VRCLKKFPVSRSKVKSVLGGIAKGVNGFVLVWWLPPMVVAWAWLCGPVKGVKPVCVVWENERSVWGQHWWLYTRGWFCVKEVKVRSGKVPLKGCGKKVNAAVCC